MLDTKPGYGKGTPTTSTDREQAKFVQHLLDKLKYCKEVLLSIHNASAGIGVGGSTGGSTNTTEAGGVSAKVVCCGG